MSHALNVSIVRYIVVRDAAVCCEKEEDEVAMHKC